MNELMNANSDFVMSSLDFLKMVINPARVAAGEEPVENSKFLKKVEDELDDLPVAKKIRHEKINNLQTPDQKYYDLTMDQMMLVGMRESKVVRKKVLEKLKELQQTHQQPQLPASVEVKQLKHELTLANKQLKFEERRKNQ